MNSTIFFLFGKPIFRKIVFKKHLLASKPSCDFNFTKKFSVLIFHFTDAHFFCKKKIVKATFSLHACWSYWILDFTKFLCRWESILLKMLISRKFSFSIFSHTQVFTAFFVKSFFVLWHYELFRKCEIKYKSQGFKSPLRRTYFWKSCWLLIDLKKCVDR